MSEEVNMFVDNKTCAIADVLAAYLFFGAYYFFGLWGLLWAIGLIAWCEANQKSAVVAAKQKYKKLKIGEKNEEEYK